MNNILEEIKELKNDPSHRAALRIFHLLENNKTQFLKKFEGDFFSSLLNGFEGLAYESPSKATTPGFKNEYNRLHELFLYQLNRL